MFGSNYDFKIFDIHSHLLPGVDDGSDSSEMSLRLIDELQRIGVSDLILTPHFSERKGYTVPRSEILEEYEKFRLEYKGDIRLHIGCESEYTQSLTEYIKLGYVTELAGTNFLLVEFAPLVKLRTVKNAVREIFAAGRSPVIAHIERYVHITADEWEEVKRLGARCQINITSFLADMHTKKRLKAIVKARIADYVGTDTHHAVPTPDKIKQVIKKMVRSTDEEYVEKILYKNALELTSGKRI